MFDTIFERIGGPLAVGAAVNKLYERLTADPLVSHYFSSSNMRELKKHQRAFLTVALGGDDAYTGRDIKRAHAHLKISDEEFDVVANHLREVLEELSVNSTQINSIIHIVAGLKPEIVSGQMAPA